MEKSKLRRAIAGPGCGEASVILLDLFVEFACDISVARCAKQIAVPLGRPGDGAAACGLVPRRGDMGRRLAKAIPRAKRSKPATRGPKPPFLPRIPLFFPRPGPTTKA